MNEPLPLPAPYELATLDALDAVISILTDQWPQGAADLAHALRERAQRPLTTDVNTQVRSVVFTTLLEAMARRMGAAVPPDPPPPGTVSLAAARARRGRSSAPSPKGAA
jgi:hypothetical protein